MRYVDIMTAKIYRAILGVLCEGISHPLRSCEDGTGEKALVRTTIENEKYNSRSVSVLSLSQHFIFVKLKWSTVLY